MNSFGSYKYADSLFLSEDYFHASIEYERLIFYTTDKNETKLFTYKKALCFKHLGDYSKAIKYFQSIYFTSPKDTLYSYVSYNLAFCYYLVNEPINSLWKIDEFLNFTSDSLSYYNFIPLKILCHNELQEWEKARSEFTLLINYSITDNIEKQFYISKIDSIYNKKHLPKILKVKKAKNLSRFIPGLGQAYAGKIGEGTVNFLINASILTFAIHQLYHRFYVTGYLGGLGLLNKTYTGGIKRAGMVASQANHNRMNEFNQEINALLIQTLK